MSLVCRVIPCLDVAAGRVVKGVNFENLRDMGDPVELAREYFAPGRRRAHVPRRDRDRRRARDDLRRGAPHRRGGLHPAHRRRRGAHRRRRRAAARRRRRQGRRQLRRDRPARPRRRDRRPVRRAGARALARREARHRARDVGLRRHHARRAHARPRSMPWTGRARPSSAVPASCWSTRSTPTARSEGFDLELVALMREVSPSR